MGWHYVARSATIPTSIGFKHAPSCPSNWRNYPTNLRLDKEAGQGEKRCESPGRVIPARTAESLETVVSKLSECPSEAQAPVSGRSLRALHGIMGPILPTAAVSAEAVTGVNSTEELVALQDERPYGGSENRGRVLGPIEIPDFYGISKTHMSRSRKWRKSITAVQKFDVVVLGARSSYVLAAQGAHEEARRNHPEDVASENGLALIWVLLDDEFEDREQGAPGRGEPKARVRHFDRDRPRCTEINTGLSEQSDVSDHSRRPEVAYLLAVSLFRSRGP